MASSELLAVAYGLASAATWGAGDFGGGLATKRTNVYSVIILSQIIGCALLIVLAFSLSGEIPSFEYFCLSGIAGISGVIGLSALYSGLSKGRMGIVASVAAVVTAGFPVIVGLFIEGLPSPLQLVGFGVALVAVWLLSSTRNGASVRVHELWLPILAGLGFGMFFIIVDKVSNHAILWPLVIARIVSISAMIIFVKVFVKEKVLYKSQLPIIILVGVFDASGSAFFALATKLGRLDISAVVASLYPATTVILAWVVLREKLNQRQWVGVLATLGALVLIAA
ncbi:EamA family transporter [Thermodesulfobacteriota bacterium]